MTVAMPLQEMAPLGSLVLADYNPRVMPDDEMAELMASIEKFGMVQPVVARAEDRLVAGGHQRIDALRRILKGRGMSEEAIAALEIPVVFLKGLTDAQVKVLNLALNKISGDWDYQKLAVMFDSLLQTNIDLDLLAVSGFSEKEINDIIELSKDPVLEPDDPSVDVQAGLAAQARRFSFEVATDAEAQACAGALKHFGMTGPGDAAASFVKVCAAAMAKEPT